MRRLRLLGIPGIICGAPLSVMLRLITMRSFLSAFILLLATSARAPVVDYDSTRRWVEDQCRGVTNTIPQEERVFVAHFEQPTFTCIMRFHERMSLREIIDQTPLKGKVVYVQIMRTEPLKSGRYTTRHDITVGPSDKSDYELKPQDVIWLRDDELIITR